MYYNAFHKIIKCTLNGLGISVEQMASLFTLFVLWHNLLKFYLYNYYINEKLKRSTQLQTISANNTSNSIKLTEYRPKMIWSLNKTTTNKSIPLGEILGNKSRIESKRGPGRRRAPIQDRDWEETTPTTPDGRKSRGRRRRWRRRRSTIRSKPFGLRQLHPFPQLPSSNL